MSRSWSAVRATALGVCALIACDEPLGPYRPLTQGEVLPVNRLIEDAISGGIDRNYSFGVDIGGEYVVFLKSFKGFVALSVDDPATGFTQGSVFSTPGATPLEENPTANIPTPQGGLLLIRVHAIDGDTARFQFKIFPVNTAPETRSPRFVFGDTVRETMDPVVDADVFYAHGEVSQTITAIVEPLGDDPGGVTLYVENPNGQLLVIVPAPGRATYTTGAIRLATTQDYRFIIRSGSVAPVPRHRGTYRFWSYVIHPGPEHINEVVPANLEIRGERIDHPGDIDEMTFAGTAGEDYNVFLEGAAPFLLLVNSPTGSGVGGVIEADADTTLFHKASGRFQVTASGTYTISVRDGNAPGLVADTGAYRLFLYRIDRRPEHVAAAVPPRQTVSGEVLDRGGDIDEFTSSGTAGETLFPSFRLTANPTPPGSIALEIVDPATKSVLSGVTLTSAGNFVRGTAFTVPAGGSYLIRVIGPDFAVSIAPYEFVVSP